MKLKLWSGFLAAVLVLSALAAMMIPAAADAPMTGDIWSVYTLTLNQNGVPAYGVSPKSGYGKDGLSVCPMENAEYTVQSDHAYSLEDGFFFELRMDDTALYADHNELVLHLWSQVGTIVGYDRSGSGFYGMITVAGDDHYLVCMGIQEGDGSGKEESKIFGMTKITAKRDGEGRFLYSISITDGVLCINGQKVEQNSAIMAFLKQMCPDGAVHVGATVLSTDGEAYSPLTVTRFGPTEATASVPAISADPESSPGQETNTTSPSDPDDPIVSIEPSETQEPVEPADTREPAESSGTQPPSEQTSDESDPQNRPTDPEDTRPTNPENGTDDPPADETDSEGLVNEGGVAQNTLDFFSKINMFDGCGSVVSSWGFAFLATLLSAAIVLKKRS